MLELYRPDNPNNRRPDINPDIRYGIQGVIGRRREGESREGKEMNKIELHKQICGNMHSTYKAKNADYGDSFAKVRAEYPEAICIRLMDKLERLKTLLKGAEQQVKGESIDDTLLDIANYAVMELLERKNERTD